MIAHEASLNNTSKYLKRIARVQHSAGRMRQPRNYAQKQNLANDLDSSASKHTSGVPSANPQRQNKPAAEHHDLLAQFNELTFHVLELSRKTSRKEVLPTVAQKALQDMDLMGLVNAQKLKQFLNKVQQTYNEEIAYHHDLHGADVMHMSFHLMNKCKLRDQLQMSDLDCMSMLIAAVCHDLGHDGFTNGYHTNAITQRAVDSNDLSV